MGFVGDDDLGYRAQAFAFARGARLTLDPTYCANQLPLLRPNDPRVIAQRPGIDTVMGRHEASRVSAVVRVAAETLDASPAYREVEAALRAASFTAKIDWTMAARRRDVLHATLYACFETAMPHSEFGTCLRRAAGFGAVAVRIGGPWIGASFNRGRIYLPLYPERRDGEDAFALLQRRLGGRETRFYTIGLFNLVDDLDAVETAELGRLIATWQATPLAEIRVEELALIETRDDLLLDGRIVDRVRF